MRIRKLVLENFGPYAKAEISFSDGINAIIGENGAGKTTLLEAIAYSLYPRSVSRQDDLIRSGASRMRVQLEFEMDGRRYLLIRERERGGSSSASLYDVTEGRKLLQRDQSKVNRQVESLLGMSRETFLQAIYVRQGEIARLLEQAPSKRRELVGRLLGIEVLERIWSELREAIGRLEKELQSVEGELRGMGDLLSEMSSLRMEKSELEEKLRRTVEREGEVERELEDLEGRIETMEVRRLKYMELKAREGSLKGSLDDVKRRIGAKRNRLEEIESQLARIEELEKLASEHEELEQVRNLMAEIIPLEERVRHLRDLSKELSEHERKLSSLDELRIRYSDLAKRVNELHEKEISLAGMEERRRQLRSRISQLERRIDELRDRVRSTVSRISGLLGEQIEDPSEVEALVRREVSRLKEDMNRLDEEIGRALEDRSRLIQRRDQALRYLRDLEGGVDKCPLCGSRLDPETVSELKRGLEREIEEITSLLREREKELGILNERRRSLEARYRKLSSLELEQLTGWVEEISSQEAELSRLREEVAQLEEKLNSLGQEIDHLGELRRELETVGRDLAERESLRERVEKIREELRGENLSQLEERMETLRRTLKEKLASLGLDAGSIDDRYRASLSAIKELQRLRGLMASREDLLLEIQELEERRAKVEEELSSVRRELGLLSFNPSELESLRRRRRKLEELLKSLARERNRVQGRIEEIEKRLSSLREKEVRLRELRKRKDILSSFRSRLIKVREIFSKDRGIQPLIRERARPTIEEELNLLFSSFNFDYDSVTLDDDFTPILRRGKANYPFSRLSGGERISLALALRLAIARFLMVSKVETFLLDEPTVHLDEERINALIETISSLNVPQMIVVTHSPRFRDVASHSILVSRAGESSSVQVVDEGDHVSD